MRLLMIILIGLLMIVGAVVSALKWLELGPFAPDTPVVEVKPSDLPPEFLDMQPLVIPLLQENGLAATVQISLKLEVRGGKNASLVKKNMPRLKDAFLQDMYAFIPRLLKDQERLDAYVLKKRFQLIADKTIEPKGTIADVLIQSVTDQPGG